MRDLHWNVGRCREHLVQKDARFIGAVRKLFRNRRSHVNDDRHLITVGRGKDASNLLDVLWIVVIHDGVPEVQLEAAEVRILRATRQFLERILSYGIDTAKSNQPVRI